jgi:hypothetical protein
MRTVSSSVKGLILLVDKGMKCCDTKIRNVKFELLPITAIATNNGGGGDASFCNFCSAALEILALREL